MKNRQSYKKLKWLDYVRNIDSMLVAVHGVSAKLHCKKLTNKAYQMIGIKPKDIKKRPEITSETTPVEYFEDLMFARVNLCSLSKIESLNTVIRFDIAGNNAGSWTIEVAGGLLKRVIRNYTDSSSPSSEAVLEPKSTFRMDSETFMSILKREITPQQAFFKKKVQIEGDIMIALKMNVLVNYL